MHAGSQTHILTGTSRSDICFEKTVEFLCYRTKRSMDHCVTYLLLEIVENAKLALLAYHRVPLQKRTKDFISVVNVRIQSSKIGEILQGNKGEDPSLN